MLGDAKEAIRTRLRDEADRVLMPLPEKSLEYLPSAVSALKKKDGWIHCYLFEHAGTGENPVEKAKRKVTEKLDSLHVSSEIDCGRVVRSTGPHWFQIALDIRASGWFGKS
jgi:tRNA G37 N-methylase Trm5